MPSNDVSAESLVEPGALVVSGVSKSFDGLTKVLDGIDLVAAPGETIVLLGPSGCGKTTLLRIIAGLEFADSGQVLLGNRCVSGPGVRVAPEQRQVGMVFQDWALFPHLSVARNVGFGLPRAERKESSRINEVLALLGLSDFGDRSPSTLSGGQQQRVALARAIAPQPALLLLDEPFSNLDASLRVQVRTEVHRMLLDLGMTTVFVTHDQDEAFVLGDKVVVMGDGKVLQAGPPAELYQHPVSRWLAGFVGDANFVPGIAQGSSVQTAFGELPLHSPLVGSVDVLLRPEDLQIEAGVSQVLDSSDLCVGVVVELVEYFGHGTEYLVIADSLQLRVRRASLPIVQRSDLARLRYTGGPVVAYPSISSIP
ncbi:MAG: ABC transporter ATP-binding protein [Microthrixaceae bacterium]